MKTIEQPEADPYDQWKAKGFSTQTVFPGVIKLSLMGTLLVGGIIALLVLPYLFKYFDEKCTSGFYEKDKAPGSFLNIVHENICGRCETEFCAKCEKT